MTSLPYLPATISAMMLRAISAAVIEPMSAPAGDLREADEVLPNTEAPKLSQVLGNPSATG